MELLALLFLSFCFLTLSGPTFGAESVPRVIAMEDDDVIIPCSLGTNENIEKVMFVWKKEGTNPLKRVFMYDPDSTYSRGQDQEFKGRVSHFPDELIDGNASIRINKTTLEDNGNYICSFPHLQPEAKTFHIELVVGAAPKPIVRQLNRNGLLQCDVERAFPKPTVEWWDSANQTLPSEELVVAPKGGRFYITLKTTATKSGLYRCVATQNGTWHQISTETYVNSDRSGTGMIRATIVPVIFGIIGIVVV